MSLGNGPNDTPSRSVDSLSELSAIETGPLVDGDFAYVTASERHYYLEKSSVEAVDSPNVVATKNSSNGASPGRWLLLQTPVTPFTREFWVDAGTSVAEADQTGSVAAPFSTINAALAALVAIPVSGSTQGAIRITAGTYTETVDLSVLEGEAAVSFIGSGDSLGIVLLTAPNGANAVEWTANDEQVPADVRFENIFIVATGAAPLGAVAIDGTLSSSFLDAHGGGLVFADCTISGGVFLTQVGRTRFSDTLIDPNNSDAEYRECGQVIFENSDHDNSKSGNPILFQYSDGGDAGYSSDIRFYGCSLCTEGRILFYGSPIVFADNGTKFGNGDFGNTGKVLIGSLAGGNTFAGPVHFTASGILSDGLAITQTPVSATSVAAIVDVSFARIVGDVETDVVGGTGRATFIAKNAVFDSDSNIVLEGKVDGDLRGATYTQSQLTGDTTATCRRTVRYLNRSVALASNSVTIADPPAPDASYIVTVTPGTVIPSSAWAVTTKLVTGFTLVLTAPNASLTADIVVDMPVI